MVNSVVNSKYYFLILKQRYELESTFLNQIQTERILTLVFFRTQANGTAFKPLTLAIWITFWSLLSIQISELLN